MRSETNVARRAAHGHCDGPVFPQQLPITLHCVTHSATNRPSHRYVQQLTSALSPTVSLANHVAISLPANMQTLTNNSDDVIIWGLQNIPGPGASNDFQRAGAGGDQQNTWSDVTLKFQQPHRFQ